MKKCIWTISEKRLRNTRYMRRLLNLKSKMMEQARKMGIDTAKEYTVEVLCHADDFVKKTRTIVITQTKEA